MNQNAVEQVLSASFLESGWDGLAATTEKLTAEQQHAAALARFENASDIARAFTGPDGELALSRLRDRTIYQPTWTPDAVSAMDGAAAGFAREGQNSIIRFIETCIRITEEGPPPQLPTTNEQE